MDTPYHPQDQADAQQGSAFFSVSEVVELGYP